MYSSEWYELFRERGCLLASPDYHFVGTSSSHLGGYGCMDPILCDPLVVRQATGQFATAFGQEGMFYAPNGWPQAVGVPAVGEIALAYPLAMQLIRALSTSYVGMVWADKQQTAPDQPTQYAITRPGFAGEVRGKRVLVVVDFMNTMHTARQLIAEVRRLGGTVVGVCALVYNHNNGVTAEALDVPVFYSLCSFKYTVWKPEECTVFGPCARQVPIVIDSAWGHGAQFRAAHPELPDHRFVRLHPQ